jgi:hypothetical protein
LKQSVDFQGHFGEKLLHAANQVQQGFEPSYANACEQLTSDIDVLCGRVTNEQ